MSYFDDNEESIIFGYSPGLRRRTRAAEARDHVVCTRYGAAELKLRMNDNGNWQLFEQERGEHNRNVPHDCHRAGAADDFEDVS